MSPGRRLFVGCVLVLVVLSGCAAEPSPSPGPGPGPGPETDGGTTDAQLRSEAEIELSQARASVESVGNRYAHLRNQTAAAERKGVNVSNVTAKLRAANRTLAAGNESLRTAERRFEAGDYRAAIDRAKAAEARADEANRTVTAAREALTGSYEAALGRARANLQRAYAEYQVAVAYVNDSAEHGANASALRATLNETRADVLAARRAIVSGRNPRRANRLSAGVTEQSRRVQNRSVTLATRAVARERISQYDSRLSSEFAGTWLTRARQSAANDRFGLVERRLLLAQYAEGTAAYDDYVKRVRLRENVTLASLDRNVSALRAQVANGTVPRERFPQVREEAAASRNALREVNHARRAIQRAEELDSFLVHADTSGARRNLTAAREALSAGRYDRATALANAARASADRERERIRERYRNGWLAGIVHSLTDAFDDLTGGEETRVAVEPPSLPQVNVTPVSVDYAPPQNVTTRPLDISDRPVSLPEAEPTRTEADAPKEEVDFALETGEPTSCGLTCREVSATLTNTGNADAHDVTATMTIYSGGQKLQTETHRVGTLPAGEQVTVRKRISLSFSEANRVRQHGARIVLVVESKEKTETFEQRYTV